MSLLGAAVATAVCAGICWGLRLITALSHVFDERLAWTAAVLASFCSELLLLGARSEAKPWVSVLPLRARDMLLMRIRPFFVVTLAGATILIGIAPEAARSVPEILSLVASAGCLSLVFAIVVTTFARGAIRARIANLLRVATTVARVTSAAIIGYLVARLLFASEM